MQLTDLCQQCSRPIAQAARGRRRQYCSPACRHTAYRQRHRQAVYQWQAEALQGLAGPAAEALQGLADNHGVAAALAAWQLHLTLTAETE